jgi:hypothetical protein
MSSEPRPFGAGRSAALVALLSLSGCPGTLNDPAAFELEASAQNSTNCDDVPDVVFAPHCGLSACHTPTTLAGNLDLVSKDVYSRLVGKNASGGPGILINPSRQPAESVVYLKLTPHPPFGSQMPLTGAKLDATTLACVANWIATGGSIDGSAPPPQAEAGEAGDEGADGPSESVPDATISHPDGGESSDAAAPDSDTADSASAE